MDMKNLTSQLTKKLGETTDSANAARIAEIFANVLKSRMSTSSDVAGPLAVTKQQSKELELPPAADAVRNVRDLANSVDFSLHPTREGEERFRSRLDAISGALRSADLSPQNERSIAHWAGQAAEILEPFTKRNFPNVIDPERVPRQLDRVLSNMEHILGLDGEGGSKSVKSGGGLDLERFLGAGASSIAQAPTPGVANSALMELSETLHSLGGAGSHFSNSGWGQHFRMLLSEGMKITSRAGGAGISADDQDYIAGIAKQMIDVLKGEPDHARMEELMDALEEKLLTISGKSSFHD